MLEDSFPAAGETIGARLKRLRLDRGLSQRELAAPGVSYAYISRIEAGTRTPSVKALRRLAANLGVSADYLETGSDLDETATRELRLADLELSVRLGEWEGVDRSLQQIAGEALAAGDRAAALRARIALATLAMERGEPRKAVELLEAALEEEPFSPIERFEIYANLGRAYNSSGRTSDAVELFERCVAEVRDAGGDATLEARYATLLSYALSDAGDFARAEDVVREALQRVDDADPYMRVRLYWSIARLAHAEGRASVALANIRKAIALLQATDDTFHLARAHMLAASIRLSRDEADAAEVHLDHAEHLLGGAPATQDVFELKRLRARIATLRGEAEAAVRLAREALDLVGSESPSDEGHAFATLGDALAVAGEFQGAEEAYRRAVDMLEVQGRFRPAANAARAWGRMLRQNGREEQALDVLERAAELGMRATPADARVEH
jgi:tetratricopeptide (TPR) repeat protein